MEADPGTPKAIVGTKAPPSLALFELSDAITPRISPLPNVSSAHVRIARHGRRRSSQSPPPQEGLVTREATLVFFLRNYGIDSSAALSISGLFLIATIVVLIGSSGFWLYRWIEIVKPSCKDAVRWRR